MRINLIGAFIRNRPFGTECAFLKGFERIGEHYITAIDPEYRDQKFDHDADATVLFKWIDQKPFIPNYWDDLKKCGGVKIVYQPDDLRFPHIQRMMNEVRNYCDYAFTFDDDGARIAKEQFGYKDAKKLLLTADDDLYTPVQTPKVLDACFIGSLSYGENHKSRMRMVELLRQDRSLKIGFATDIYDVREISRIYSASKVVLNHATDVGQKFGTGYGYQCRHFEAGFTRSALLSNVVLNDNSLRNFANFSSEEQLVENLRFLVAKDSWREELADKFYRELKTRHRPEHRAQEMVEMIRSWT